MAIRGHEVRYWAPRPRAYRLLANTRFAKWAGYVDQYVLFPIEVKRELTRQPIDTLFVFCDQALGPWVPLVSHRPHVVHAHDLLALRSALGLIPENPTSWSGRIYQRYIRRGFQRARHFIPVSHRTKEDLERFGGVRAQSSTVVFNGMNFPYEPLPNRDAMDILRAAGLPADERGMILHVGGGQWYKNTAGVIRLYASYARRHANPLPLWMVSPTPTSPSVLAALAEVPGQGVVRFFQGIDNRALQAAYSVAHAFLFPSLAEGFGWPIVEAQACGCPVITTDDAPMNEIGGPLAEYLPIVSSQTDWAEWAENGADVLDRLVASGEAFNQPHRQSRVDWAKRFTLDAAIEGYWNVYRSVVSDSGAVISN